MVDFNEYSEYQVSRYDRYTEKMDMLGYVRQQLIELYDVIKDEEFPVFSENFYFSKDMIYIFDILELWHSGLSDGEKSDFQRAVNQVFQLNEYTWLLVDGRIFKIDSAFIEREVISPLIEKMMDNNFAGALNEFAEAQNDFMLQNYKGAILNACKSFESTLKTVLEKNKGSAKDLLNEIASAGLFDDLPEEIAKGFGDKTFMILPFLRNRLAGHGQGEEIVELNAEYSRLAINLSASFNLFFINKHIAKKTELNSKIDFMKDEILF